MLPSGQLDPERICAKTGFLSGDKTASASARGNRPRGKGTLVSTSAPNGGGPAGGATWIVIPVSRRTGADCPCAWARAIGASEAAAPVASVRRRSLRRENLLRSSGICNTAYPLRDCWYSGPNWSGRTGTYSLPSSLMMPSAISRLVSQFARNTCRKAGRRGGVQRLISLTM